MPEQIGGVNADVNATALGEGLRIEQADAGAAPVGDGEGVAIRRQRDRAGMIADGRLCQHGAGFRLDAVDAVFIDIGHDERAVFQRPQSADEALLPVEPFDLNGFLFG